MNRKAHSTMDAQSLTSSEIYKLQGLFSSCFQIAGRLNTPRLAAKIFVRYHFGS